MANIKLNSNHLKPGDKIIRVKPLYNQGIVSNSSWTNQPVTVVKKHPHHIEVTIGDDIFLILPFYKWNDGNWKRWK